MNRTQADQGPAREAATIRPPGPADLAAVSGFFAGLSLRSRVQRFFAPVRPTPALVRLACGLAGPAGPAGGGPASATDALVATRGGVIIGHAMAVDRPAARTTGQSREPTMPPSGPVTEIGVVVADTWQGQGVGAALVRALLSRAQARGVTSLSMDVLPGNQQVLAMVAAHWTAARTERHADCVTIQTALAPDPLWIPPSEPSRPAPRLAPDRDRGARCVYPASCALTGVRVGGPVTVVHAELVLGTR